MTPGETIAAVLPFVCLVAALSERVSWRLPCAVVHRNHRMVLGLAWTPRAPRIQYGGLSWSRRSFWQGLRRGGIKHKVSSMDRGTMLAKTSFGKAAHQ